MKRSLRYAALMAAMGAASIAQAQLATDEPSTPVASSKAVFAPPVADVIQLRNSDEPAWIQLTSATVETEAEDVDAEPVEQDAEVRHARAPGVGVDEANDPREEGRTERAALLAEEEPLEEVSPAPVQGGCKPNCCETAPCCPPPCCPPPCCPCFSVATHRTNFFGDYLFLRAHNVDMAYAQPRNGLNPATSTPAGAVGVAEPQWRSGFRVGGAYAINPCSSIVTTFSWFETNAGNTIATTVPDSIHSLLTYPTTASASANSLIASGTYGIRFRTADAEYRRLIWGGQNFAFNWSAGARYAHLGQNFSATELITPGTTFVDSRITFDGGGPRFGLDGERRVHNGFMVYGRTGASFVAGSFRAAYNQYNTFFLNQANVSWKDERIVPILEAELGAGWASCNGRIRVSGGYYVGSWFNTVATPLWITGAQSNNFTNVSQSIVFDGLVSRFEYCF